MTDSALLDVYKRLPVKIVRGQGAWVVTDDGRLFLDLYAGHAVTATGHCHPRLVAALQGQLAQLVFYSNAVHVEHQEEAAQLLVDALPAPLAGQARVFFVNSGAEAVENALKLARRATGRRRIVAFEGGFHGRTLGALAVTGLEKYRQSAGVELGGTVFAPFGTPAGLEVVAAELAKGDVAAVLLEPIQSLAGVRTAPGAFFRELRALCDRSGTLLIYDELQTGFGRTGTFAFAGRHGVVPDLLTFGKGMGSGLPVAACVVSSAVAATVKPGDAGTTFGGGPLACLAVKTTLEILRDEQVLTQVTAGAATLTAGLAALPGVEEVRGEGYLLGLRLSYPAAQLQQALFKEGVLAGTSDDPRVLRLMPPLTLTATDLDEGLGRFADAVERAVVHV